MDDIVTQSAVQMQMELYFRPGGDLGPGLGVSDQGKEEDSPEDGGFCLHAQIYTADRVYFGHLSQ